MDETLARTEEEGRPGQFIQGRAVRHAREPFQGAAGYRPSGLVIR